MLLTIPQVLSPQDLIRLRQLLDAAPWADGGITAGLQSAQEKRNLQLPESATGAAEARAIVLAALARSGRVVFDR